MFFFKLYWLVPKLKIQIPAQMRCLTLLGPALVIHPSLSLSLYIYIYIYIYIYLCLCLYLYVCVTLFNLYSDISTLQAL